MKGLPVWMRSIAVVLFALLAARAYGQRDCSAPVKTTEGEVRGFQETAPEACAWKGIPYAAPPIGDLRWRSTMPALSRSGILEATQVGMSCPQKEEITSGGKSIGFSEDCLFLNIWSPKKDGNFPVMVFFHGGGFQQGSGGYGIYNGKYLAGEKEVVLVTVNYRIGNLGFLALPELNSEDKNGSFGNYGILDQIQALKWLKANVRNFGGDPGRITIFGQSAGAMSVCALMVSPLSEGLFERAISMSGPCDLFFSMDEGFEQGKKIAETVGCTGDQVLACLRSKPAESLVVKSGNRLLNLGVTYAPHVDGYVLPDFPIKMIKQGKYHRVPFMVGNTKEEIRLYTMMFAGIGLVQPATINWLMRKLAGDYAQDVLKMYSYKDYRRPIDLFLNVANDMVFAGPAWQMGEAMSGKSPVYMYRVDWHDHKFPHKMGAFHGMDVPLVFGTLKDKNLMTSLMADKKVIERAAPLSRQMMDYYTNFAKSGNPNGSGLLDWPGYDTAKKNRMILDTPLKISPLSDQELKRFAYFEKNPMKEIVKSGQNGKK